MEVRQLTLQFLIIHHELVSRNVVIGEVMLSLGHVELTGQEVNMWKSLQPYNFQNVRFFFCVLSPFLYAFN